MNNEPVLKRQAWLLLSCTHCAFVGNTVEEFEEHDCTRFYPGWEEDV